MYRMVPMMLPCISIAAGMTTKAQKPQQEFAELRFENTSNNMMHVAVYTGDKDVYDIVTVNPNRTERIRVPQSITSIRAWLPTQERVYTFDKFKPGGMRHIVATMEDDRPHLKQMGAAG